MGRRLPMAYYKNMHPYDKIRQLYRPAHIRVLLIAESPPPEAEVPSSRHFYRSDKVRTDDRLFTNTIRALYPETTNVPEAELEQDKGQWLQKLQSAGWYMIEALEESLKHEVTKPQRQELIRKNLPRLVERVRGLANQNTVIILIKSNVFDVASEPLRQAGFTVLNTALVDYPGRFNQKAYREKLAELAKSAGQSSFDAHPSST
jgi:hypothetical protein